MFQEFGPLPLTGPRSNMASYGAKPSGAKCRITLRMSLGRSITPSGARTCVKPGGGMGMDPAAGDDTDIVVVPRVEGITKAA